MTHLALFTRISCTVRKSTVTLGGGTLENFRTTPTPTYKHPHARNYYQHSIECSLRTTKAFL